MGQVNFIFKIVLLTLFTTLFQNFFKISAISSNLLCSNFLKAHAQKIGDAKKVPLGKPIKIERSKNAVKIENMDLENLQANLTSSIKKQKMRPDPPEVKMDQGDSAVSTETLMDVRSQQLRGKFLDISFSIQKLFTRGGFYGKIPYHEKIRITWNVLEKVWDKSSK